MSTITYNGFSRVDKILKTTVKNYNLQDALNKHQAIKNWQKVASSFVENAENLTQAIDFKRGVLTVACISRDVAYKLRQMAEKIMSILNEVLGRRVVFALYLEV